MRKYLYILISALSALIASETVLAGENGKLSPTLDMIWSVPVAEEKCTAGDTCTRGEGFQLTHGVMRPDGTVSFLAYLQGSERRELRILKDAITETPDLSKPVALKDGATPLSVTTDTEGNIILGGYSDRKDGFPIGAVYAKPYIAVVDADGNPIFQHAYEQDSWPPILDITAAPAGGVFAAGRGGFHGGWLARFDDKGQQLWKVGVGNAKGISVVPSKEGGALVVSFVGNGEKESYREDVALWHVNDDGAVGEPTIIEPAINTSRSGYYGNIQAVPAMSGAYIATQWSESITRERAKLKPIFVTRVDSAGHIIWHQALGDTIGDQVGSARFELCRGLSIVSLPSGNALMACTLSGKIHLYEFEEQSGSYSVGYLPLPECNEGRSSDLFLFSNNKGALYLASTRPQSNLSTGCSWIGKLTL
jgi:hypothetical protein